MPARERERKATLEWYKLMLILIGAFGIVLALVHWYVSGVDIPNGLLTILTLIISATLGPNAVSSITDTIRGRNNTSYNSNADRTRRRPQSLEEDQEEDSPYPIDISDEVDNEEEDVRR